MNSTGGRSEEVINMTVVFVSIIVKPKHTLTWDDQRLGLVEKVMLKE